MTRLLPAALLLLTACVSAQQEQDPQPPPVVDANAVRREAFAAELRGDAAEAAEGFLKLSQIEPTEPNWIERAADNLGRAGRFNDALDLLEKGIGRFPDVLSLQSMLARTYHLKADTMRAQGVRDSNVVFHYQDAARTAEKVLEIDPGHLDARLIVASAWFQLGDYDAALAQAEQAVERHPEAYGGHAMVGRICFQRYVEGKQRLASEELVGDERVAVVATTEVNRARARSALEAAAKADPDRAFPLMKLGDLAAWEGDLDAGLGWYGKAIVIDPKSQVDHGWLRTAVDADRRREFYGRVRTAHEARADATPESAATIAWYEGQAAFDQAASSAPATPPAQRAKAWKDAGDLFAKALEALPDYIDTYWWLMQARYWSGDVDAAARVAVEFARRNPRRFADMIRQDEQTVAALTGMAASAYQAGALGESRELNQVLAYARQTADAWNNYAFLCRETRRFEESLRAYEEALAIEPESPQLMNDAGVILQYHMPGADSKARARRYYEEAIRLAEAQIAKGGLEDDALARTRTALRDARMNLAKLR